MSRVRTENVALHDAIIAVLRDRPFCTTRQVAMVLDGEKDEDRIARSTAAAYGRWPLLCDVEARMVHLRKRGVVVEAGRLERDRRQALLRLSDDAVAESLLLGLAMPAEVTS